MPKYAFHLSGDVPNIAVSEISSLFLALGLKFKLTGLQKNVALVETNASAKDVIFISARSALLHSATLVHKTLKHLHLSDIGRVNFSFVKSPFCVRVDNLSHASYIDIEKRLATPIWWFFERRGKLPKVDLEKPKTIVHFTLLPDRIYVSEQLWKTEKGRFLKREPNEKPFFHPTALRPKWARLLVNLTQLKAGQTILDPFCGTGSVLIEAGLLGIKPIGLDFDSRMIKGAKGNLEHYKKAYRYKKYNLVKGNATQLEKSFGKNSIDGIATDPPYGRSSIVGAPSLRILYSEFLKSAHKVLKPKKYLVMLYPDSIDALKLINKKQWKAEQIGDIYVHGSLTRKLVVLKKI